MTDWNAAESGDLPGRCRWLQITSLAGPAFFFLALISYNFVDIDLWHQMALIRESLRAGHLLRADPFAYTPTIAPWIDHEWGAGAVAYFATLWFGGRALLVLKFLLALGTGALCWRCSTKLGADYRLTSVCAPIPIFLTYLGFFAVVRAQVYSFFFLAVLVTFWEFDRRGSRSWLIAWLMIFPLWVNLHGGFVSGIGLTALYCMERALRGESIRRMLIALLGMVLEVFLTPYGNAYLQYLRRALWMSRPFAPEWRPIWDLGPAWVICFIAAVAVVFYAWWQLESEGRQAFSRSRPRRSKPHCIGNYCRSLPSCGCRTRPSICSKQPQGGGFCNSCSAGVVLRRLPGRRSAAWPSFSGHDRGRGSFAYRSRFIP